MFNLDAFADSMKESVPKKMNFTLYELCLIERCLNLCSNLFEECITLDDNLSFDILENLVEEFYYKFDISVTYSQMSKDIRDLFFKFISFSFN